MNAACEAARRAFDSLLSGSDVDALARADVHADACPGCASHRDEVYRRLADDAAFESVPAGLEERLVGTLRSRRVARRMRLAAVGLCVFAAVGAGVATMRVEADAVRRRDSAIRRNEAIERLIRQDRALLASDPMSGSPAFSFAGPHRP